MRLDKFLTQNKIGSRSEVKNMLKKGLVTVNDCTIKQSDLQIKEETDVVRFRGNVISNEPFVYYVLNKPSGYVSAVSDNLFPTVTELLKEEGRDDLFPVGRLDKDTEGLLLLTNDGPLSHALLSPKKHVSKTYYARVRGKVTEETIELFAKGFSIGEKKDTRPASLTILKTIEDETEWLSEVELILTEGKFHQVKRMFLAVGMEVLYLKRVAMGKLLLKEIPIGSYIKIKKSDIIDETERG